MLIFALNYIFFEQFKSKQNLITPTLRGEGDMSGLIRKISIVILCFSILVQCTHKPPQAFNQALNEGRCEEGLEVIHEYSENIKYIGPANRAAGKTISYAVAGAGYTTDVVLKVVSGAVMFIALCAPVALAESASSTPNTHISCLPGKFNVIDTKLGSAGYKSTEVWRCPDLSALADGIHRVAICHEKRADKEGLKSAKQTLDALITNSKFMNCISKPIRNSIYNSYDRIAQLNKN